MSSHWSIPVTRADLDPRAEAPSSRSIIDPTESGPWNIGKARRLAFAASASLRDNVGMWILDFNHRSIQHGPSVS